VKETYLHKMAYTKFEVARLVGARALQIKMGAPTLVKIPKGVERPLDIAKIELEHGVLPITVKEREGKKIKREVKVIPEIPIEGEEVEETPEAKEPAEEFEEELVVEEAD
jgi:DNA-directed RNA polymerase subunit K